MGLGVKTIGIRPLLPAIIRLMFGATTRRRNPGLIDEWRRRFADVDVQSVLHCLYGLVSRDSVLSCLSEFSVPSLVMVGDEDRSLPASRSQRIHNCLPDSEYQVIRGAGHLSALEQPSQVNGVLTEFLRRVTKSAVAT
jgi:3-oxoadipate enol-lactonase